MKAISAYLMLVLILFFFACRRKAAKTKELLPVQVQNDTLHYQTYGNGNHIVLNSIIQDSIKTRLIYDTGAGANLVLDSAFTVKQNWFKPIGAALQDTLKDMGFGPYADQRNLLSARKIDMQLGKIRDSLPHTEVANLRKIIKNEADGIIGNDFMSRYVVEINYINKFLVLHRPEDFRDGGKYDTIPVKYGGKYGKYISMDVTYYLTNGKHFSQTVLLDLGVGKNYLIIANNYLINKFDLQNQIQHPEIREKLVTIFRTGSRTITGNIKSVTIGKSITIDTPKIGLLVNDDPKKRNTNGYMLVGNYIFKRFGKIFIDYQQNKIYVPR
ncbi:MAG: hypothetical protein V4541_01220 [Bacteroidota bacterium]